jgi:hypothetical protein
MKEFMIAVERAVRPVQATEHRKLRMRQELLAHLTALFEEERARLGNDEAARAEALRRFGNPADLTRELQGSVPLVERTLQTPVPGVNRLRFLAPLFRRRPAEPVFCHALRLATLWAAFSMLLHCLLYLLRTGFALPAGREALLVAGCLALVAVAAFAFMLLAALMGHVLGGRTSPGALAGGVGLAVLACLVQVAAVPPGLVLLLGEVKFRPGPVLFGFTCCLVILLLVGFAIRAADARTQQLHEWTSLEIGS